MGTAILYALLLFLPLLLLLINKKKSSKQRLPVPPGSLGIPIIGQSLSVLRAMKSNKCEDWFRKRVRKYGPISKLNLFGTPSVFLNGQAANKFIYTCGDKILANQQPASIRKILGERNILELSGSDHRRVRGAFVSFLKPEALKLSVGRIDEEIRMHLTQHWHDKHQNIKVMPLMKSLTFNVICSTMFGIEHGSRRETLVKLFENVMSGMLAVPINLPFTRFSSSLSSRSKIRDIILELMSERRRNFENLNQYQDLITSLISIQDERCEASLSDDEIVDNCIVAMLAGYDTTSTLLTFLIKLLAEDSSIYNNILDEQEEIARGKASGEFLTWDDLTRMKYTWRVATETLRMNPPVFFTFRKVLQDFEYEGYLIPKGWQVVWAAFTTHMEESIFAEPMKFNPPRFESQPPPYSFVAFGGGPRMCPGYEFARIETLTMIHYLVTSFKWKLRMQQNFVGRDPMPVFDQGLPIQVELKKPTYSTGTM
ncbi:cytochrome P450 716B1-like [Primulina tabacum]|uniref:cytochrome P450 716B1-like n=1 Tax=Primulina tabacum TaxID=48773 RepID=UPI003F5A7032